MSACLGKMWKDIFFVLFLCKIAATQDYEVPEATVEILHPKGFTVSIPDQEGIKLFAFHGKINEKFDGLEAGQFARDITKSRDGKWTFRDSSTRFKPGDEIHYWLYVDYNNGKHTLGYRREDQKFVVTDVPKNNGNKGNQGQGNKPTQPPTPVTQKPNPICNSSPSVVNGQSKCSGELLFEENFNDLNKWQREVKFADNPDYEFVIYDGDSANVNTNNGQLHIKPTYAENKYGVGFVTVPGGLNLGINCTSTEPIECKKKPAAFFILPPVISGRINTRPSFSFLYGKIDIKAKLPKGNWIYPELLLTPKNQDYGTQDYASGEIRVAFLLGNENLDKELKGGVILGTTDEARQYGLRSTSLRTSWSDDFHVFTTIWKPDSIQLLVDGTVYGNISPPPGGFANVVSNFNTEAANKWKSGGLIAPFDKEMLVTIGVGVGGWSFPDTITNKPYTNLDGKAQYKFYKAKDTWLPTWGEDSELIVDYIKVYAI